MLLPVSAVKSMELLLKHIFLGYLYNLYAICEIHINGSIQIAGNNYDTKHFQVMIFEYVKEQRQMDSIVLTGINGGCQAFVVDTKISEQFLNSYNCVRFYAEHRYTANHFVFYSMNPLEDFGTILENSAAIDLSNLLFLHLINLHTVKIFTARFVGRRWSDITAIIFLDTWFGSNATFQFNANLFPDKLINLELKAMRIALFNYKPYSLWKAVPANEGNAIVINEAKNRTVLIDGTESMMFIEFCRIFNCTLQVSLGVCLDESGEWGIIYENSTGDGVLGAVVERRADVGISALYAWYHEFLFLEFSAAMSRTGITCVVPKPKRRSGWLMPVMPFSTKLWIAVLTSFIIGTFSIYLINLYKTPFSTSHQFEFSQSILLVGGLYIFQPTNIRFTRVAEMIIITCVLLIGLSIGNAYCGGLASVLTVPQYEKPIDTVEELAASDMEWGATHDAWIFSILEATQPDILRLLKHFRTLNKDDLKGKAKTGDFSFSIERLSFGHYAIGDYITEDAIEYLQLMPYDIYWEYCFAMSYKNWPLQIKLNNLILLVAQSGIQKYWELIVVMGHSNNKVQLGVSTSHTTRTDGQSPRSIKFENFSGVFLVWSFGLILSVFLFGIEFLGNKTILTNI